MHISVRISFITQYAVSQPNGGKVQEDIPSNFCNANKLEFNTAELISMEWLYS